MRIEHYVHVKLPEPIGAGGALDSGLVRRPPIEKVIDFVQAAFLQ